MAQRVRFERAGLHGRRNQGRCARSATTTPATPRMSRAGPPSWACPLRVGRAHLAQPAAPARLGYPHLTAPPTV
jgi:hypothetical protein